MFFETIPERLHSKFKPGLNQNVTFGRNGNGEVAEVFLYDPKNFHYKVIVTKNGYFKDFPGIIQGSWTKYIEGEFDFDAGQVQFRTSFEKCDDGYRCLWEIQPDGRYWGDDYGFGMDNDVELVLYADLDERGVFKGPFQIYKIGAKKVKN